MSDRILNSGSAVPYLLLAALFFALPSFLAVPTHKSLAGSLLIAASRSIMAGSFAHSVIYIARHDDLGAVGFVVNRPAKDKDVFYGGPVDQGRRSVLHSRNVMLPQSTELPGIAGLAITESEAVDGMLEKMGKGEGPRQARLFYGYAGWAPGQLDGEIRMGHWKVIGYDEALVFSNIPDRVWEQANMKDEEDAISGNR